MAELRRHENCVGYHKTRQRTEIFTLCLQYPTSHNLFFWDFLWEFLWEFLYCDRRRCFRYFYSGNLQWIISIASRHSRRAWLFIVLHFTVWLTFPVMLASSSIGGRGSGSGLAGYSADMKSMTRFAATSRATSCNCEVRTVFETSEHVSRRKG